MWVSVPLLVAGGVVVCVGALILVDPMFIVFDVEVGAKWVFKKIFGISDIICYYNNASHKT